VTTTLLDTPYTLKRVQEMLGLSRTTISGLIEAGFVAPVRGARNEYRFSFQDLMLMRTAFALQQASIPPRKILRSLARLKAALPAEVPLTGLRITAVGADVTVRDRSGQWQADSGQLLIDFEVADVAGTVSFIPAAASRQAEVPVDWFKRGLALEPTDAAAAEDAYRRAIAVDPTSPAPYLNLGALLCESGRCADAVSLYENALTLVGHAPLIHFNLGIALEDLEHIDSAVAAYQRALRLDANLADAHYNLGVLLDKRGDGVGARRHFNAYRRLELQVGP
jgi:tetratricopeptide (TPR) repeat protein